jgi:glutathione S-transferase
LQRFRAHGEETLGVGALERLVSIVAAAAELEEGAAGESSMKIYDSQGAPNPRRVRMFLAEKGIQVPYEPVDIGKAVNRQTEFLKINPLAGVPVLELDDGTHIAESVAICRYFEEVQPEPPLFGVGAKERALVEMWNRRIELAVMIPIADSFRQQHAFFKGRIRQVPDYAEAQKLNAQERLTWLDGELANRKFIAGDNFSIADITALIAIDFGRVSKIAVQPEQKNLARWHAEVSARPSAKA